ncbi:hypothetical protein IVB30_10485 [Bradyrhizobium sp. 200]|uniref:hypothetical protein n=1 Tax=Bradyrhizobium sp. 200 TaxID=2782665 RepID=UPI001FFECC75|nr:hypothetical protein [Bradyrhizobium sp. 200]UPJ51732.1 hypothetical protein IVB30_10485 [Bradyrhizobium sp. 200]
MSKSMGAALIASAMACSIAASGGPIDLQANPPALREAGKNIGSGDPAVRTAQAARERRTTNVPQIFYNIVTDGGAACNGDVATVSRSVSIGRGARVLSVSADTFSSGDVGKAIVIPGAGNNGGRLSAYIQSFINAQTVNLDRGAATGLSVALKDIGYGTDDAPKFMAFNKWARENQGAKQVVLTVPRGANCWFGSPVWSTSVSLQNAWAAGINNLIVEGAGATINSVGGAGFWLGGRGVCQAGLDSANGCSARIETAQAGAKQITLTASSLAAGYIRRFPVGKWLLLGGLDTQGLWKAPYGFPPNQTFFEWRQVTAVDTITGVLTLDRPLSNTYLSTWPNYNQGNNYEADNGGPATIWAVGDSWNSTIEYRGLTINQEGQTYSPARHVTYRGVTFGGGHGGIPTQNETWSAINSNFADVNMETDKLIGTITMDGVTIRQIKFQSSSTDRLVMKNSTVTKMLDGTAKRAEITDSVLGAFKVGAYAYGVASGPVVCTRCAVATFDFYGGFLQKDLLPSYSMNDGIISFPNTAATGSGPAHRWAVPGTTIFWSAPGYFTIGSVQLRAVKQDANNTYIETNAPGGFPSIGSPISYRTGLMPRFTCDACSGDPALVATNIQSGATPLAPLATYSRRSYAPNGPSKNLGSLVVIGKLVSLTINVTQAYTGSDPAILNPTGEFHNFTVKQSGWSRYDWWPTINLKVAGERVITPTGVTCNGVPGGCSGDLNMTVPEAIWIANGMGPSLPSLLNSKGSKMPTFTITARTDQAVVP